MVKKMLLDAFFRPKKLTVLGDTGPAGPVAEAFVSNLSQSPFRERMTASLAPDVDLAIIATDAGDAPEAVRRCAEIGVSAAIVTADGCDDDALRRAAANRVRILGSASFGVLNPHTGWNATAAPGMPPTGSVAFLSQSAALCAAILDWSRGEAFGFSAFVSIGTMVNTGWAEFLDYLNTDPHTRSIVLYLETIGDARSFLSAAREAALKKPVVLLKPSGDDDVFDAAFRRCGALRVDTIAELFYTAEVLSKVRMPDGPNLTIVTNAGAPAALAAGALDRAGGKLAMLSARTVADLDRILPGRWSRRNPIDILGDAGPERFERTTEIALADPDTNGVLVILSPMNSANPTRVAERLAHVREKTFKPLLASWMGGEAVAEGDRILTSAGIPVFPYPDTAARLFEKMWRRSDDLRALYETPSRVEGPHAQGAAACILDAQSTGRLTLSDSEVSAVFERHAIPKPRDGASGTAISLLASTDERFGMVIHFDDDACSLPPLNTTLARRMVERASIFSSIAADTAALEELDRLLVKFSRMLIAERPIRQCRAGVRIGGGQAVIETVSIELHPLGTPLPRLAIRPYPAQYMRDGTLKDGSPVRFRPLAPEDEPLLVDFHGRLSERSVYLRYFQLLPLSRRVDHDRLTRICFNDYDREIAILAERPEPRSAMGIGRLTKEPGTADAEFAAIVADDCQGKGLGKELVRQILAIARNEGIREVKAQILPENRGMIGICKSFGFTLRQGGLAEPLDASLLITNTDSAR